MSRNPRIIQIKTSRLEEVYEQIVPIARELKFYEGQVEYISGEMLTRVQEQILFRKQEREETSNRYDRNCGSVAFVNIFTCSRKVNIPGLNLRIKFNSIR